MILRLRPQGGHGVEPPQTPPEIGISMVDVLHITISVLKGGSSTGGRPGPSPVGCRAGRRPSLVADTGALPVSGRAQWV